MDTISGGVPADLLAGRTVLVAGGTGSVGGYVVAALLAGGARVVVPSRSPEKLERLRAWLGGAADGDLVTFVGDIGDESTAERVRDEAVERAGPLDGAIASLGGFVTAPSVLAAPLDDLRRALDGYLLAHFVVARTLIPALEERGGSYTFVNGPLAFDPLYPGTGLISIATAAQAMLARVAFRELAESRVRVNEVVLYTRFGWGAADRPKPGEVGQEDVGRYLAYLASDRGASVRGRTIHLSSPERIEALAVGG